MGLIGIHEYQLNAPRVSLHRGSECLAALSLVSRL
jgi:hypothetical protein